MIHLRYIIWITLLGFGISKAYTQHQDKNPQRVLTRLESGTHLQKLRQFMQEQSYKLYKTYPQLNLQVWESVGEKDTPETLLNQLSVVAAELVNQPSFQLEKDVSYQHQVIPNDPAFHRQWSLRNTGQYVPNSLASIQAAEAWELQTGDSHVVVGVIDSGIDWQHPDLARNIWQNLGEDIDGDGRVLEYIEGRWQFDPGDEDGQDTDGNGYVDDFIGWDFVNNDNDPTDDHIFGHGTHVAGIIAAEGNNGIGISGVSWRAALMPLKFLNAEGNGFSSDAIAALAYAQAMGAQLSNNSWGSGIFSQSLLEAILAFGHPFIAAAGNNYGNDNDLVPLYPASYDLPNILSVAATDFNDQLAAFSNLGAFSVDFAAPGVGIYSTLPRGVYGFLNGTSMAAPHVSGAVCLLLSDEPGLSSVQLKDRFFRSVDIIPALQGSILTGGRLNIFRLLQRPISFQASLEGNSLTVEGLLQGSDQGYMLLAETEGHAAIIQLNSLGELQAIRQIEAEGEQVTSSGLRSPEGDYWLAGSSDLSGQQEAFITVLDADGNLVRQTQYSTNGADDFQQLLYTSDQQVVALGTREDESINGIAASLLKFDSQGNIIWQKAYKLGATELNIKGSVATRDGGLMLLATHKSNDTFAALLAKFDEGGDYEWGKIWRMPNYMHTYAMALVEEEIEIDDDDPDPLDDEYLMALVAENGPNRQILIVEINALGHATDVENYQITGLAGELQLQHTTGGGFQFSGSLSTDGSVFIVQSDKHGNIQWSKRYFQDNSRLTAVSLRHTLDGGAALVANKSTGGIQIIKTDVAGNSGCQEADITIMPLPEVWPQSQSLQAEENVIQLQLQSLNPPISMLDQALTMICSNAECEVRAIISPEDIRTCRGGSLQFRSLSQGAISLEWQVDGISIGSTTEISHIFENDGIFEVMLIAREEACADQSTVSITVDRKPRLNLQDSSLCATVMLVDAGIPNLRYEWRDRNTGELLGNEQELRVSQSREIELSVIDACGNDDSDKMLVSLTGDCVWPGDVTADGTVDMVDFLMLGTVHGSTGPLRPNASSEFIPQEGPAWAASFPITNPWAANVNLKHADCDGDGLVDIKKEAEIIRQNATDGQSRIISTEISPLSLYMETTQNVVNLGDTIFFDFVLENTASSQVENVYGLAFQLDYNLPLSSLPFIETNDSWLGNDGSDLATLSLANRQNRRIQYGVVRYDRTEIDGDGRIARGGVVIFIEDIGDVGALGESAFFSISISQAVLIQADGTHIPINSLNTQNTQSFVIQIPQLTLDVNAYLQGAWDSSQQSMRTDLRQKGLLPTEQPYLEADTLSIDDFPPQVVDWVLVELRDKTDPTSSGIRAQKAALILEDGHIVDAETYKTLSLFVEQDDYYVVLKHRNHLAVMSPRPVSLSLFDKLIWDFSSGSAQAIGEVPLAKLAEGKYGLYAGDLNQDGKISFSGPDNDRRHILLRIGGRDPNQKLLGYWAEDLNMDGQVDYVGDACDRTSLLKVVGASSLNKVIKTSLPE